MKLFKLRRRRAAAESVLPEPAFSTRQLTAMVVAMSLALVLFSNVFITDPTNTSQKAHRDAGAGSRLANVDERPWTLRPTGPSPWERSR
jgi:hypothetical protein